LFFPSTPPTLTSCALLRIEFPGTTYHVTSRSERREPIYRDAKYRTTQLEIIARAMDRFDAQVLAYCQLGNHFHLLLRTPRPLAPPVIAATRPSKRFMRGRARSGGRQAGGA
jgi:REP element-mobilizing transposase RayT